MQNRCGNRGWSNLWRGATAGALGGFAGAAAMVMFNHLLGRSEDGERPHHHHRVNASPNDTDGTIADEPASMQVASVAVEKATGAPLDERGKKIGGSIVHYLFGASVGALYGAAAEWNTSPTALGGLPFGTGVWIAADELGLPLAGLARAPVEYPASRHLAAFASHLVYGLTTETVRRGMRGRR
jgi:Protein of unknown function (DUF1440)